MLTAMSPWRFVSRIVLIGLIFPLASALPAGAAPDSSGWFEADTRPAPSEVSAPAQPEPAPAAAEMQSLEPSPLLEDSRARPAPEPAETYEERDPRALTDFRPTLDPYGTWENHPRYGTVWIPRRDVVGTNFAPYVSSGRWALDETGEWVWVSDYPFGSVVFHYGRWAWIGGAGWAWIPGYRYAPAWVVWRVPTGSYSYVGWAPMGPDYIWYNGAAVSFGFGVSTSWVFCPSVYVFHRHVHHYVVRDRVTIERAAAHTRRYVPATPRSYAAASPRGTARSERRAYAAPSLEAARVPAHAVPRERVRQDVPVRAARRASADPGGRGFAAPSSVRQRVPGDARPLPAPRRIGPSDRVEADRRIQPQPRRIDPAPRLEPRRIEPAPRAAEPRRIAPAPRVEPRRIAPVPRMEPRRIEPAPRVEPRRLEPTRRVEPRRMEPMRRIEPMRMPRGGGPTRSLPRGRP